MKKLSIFIIMILLCFFCFCAKFNINALELKYPYGYNYLDPANIEKNFSTNTGCHTKNDIYVKVNVVYTIIFNTNSLSIFGNGIRYVDDAERIVYPSLQSIDKEYYYYANMKFTKEFVSLNHLPFNNVLDAMMYEGYLQQFRGIQPYHGYEEGFITQRLIQLPIESFLNSGPIEAIKEDLNLVTLKYILLYPHRKVMFYGQEVYEIDLYVLVENYYYLMSYYIIYYDNDAPVIVNDYLFFEYFIVVTNEMILEQLVAIDNFGDPNCSIIEFNQNHALVKACDQYENETIKDLVIVRTFHPLGTLIFGPNKIEVKTDESYLSETVILSYFSFNPLREESKDNPQMILENPNYFSNEVGIYGLFIIIELEHYTYRFPFQIEVVQVNYLPPNENLDDEEINTDITTIINDAMIISYINNKYSTKYPNITNITIDYNGYKENYNIVGTYYVFYSFTNNTLGYSGRIVINVTQVLDSKKNDILIWIAIPILSLAIIATSCFLIFGKKKKYSK